MSLTGPPKSCGGDRVGKQSIITRQPAAVVSVSGEVQGALKLLQSLEDPEWGVSEEMLRKGGTL